MFYRSFNCYIATRTFSILNNLVLLLNHTPHCDLVRKYYLCSRPIMYRLHESVRKIKSCFLEWSMYNVGQNNTKLKKNKESTYLKFLHILLPLHIFVSSQWQRVPHTTLHWSYVFKIFLNIQILPKNVPRTIYAGVFLGHVVK